MSKKLSPIQQESKLKVLQNCMDDMDEMMGEGLDKKKSAKKAIIPKKEQASGEALIEGSEDEESEEVESDSDEMSEEEIDAKIQELMAKKKKSPSA